MVRWLRGRAGEWLAVSQASRGGSRCWTEEEQSKQPREPPWDTAGRTHRFEGKKMQDRKEQLEWKLQFCDMGFSRRSYLWRGSLKILTTRVIEHCSLLKRAGKLGDTEGPGWATAPNDTHPSGLFLPMRLHQSPDPPESASPAGGQTCSTWAWHEEGRCGFKAAFHVFRKCPRRLTCSQSAFLPFE